MNMRTFLLGAAFAGTIVGAACAPSSADSKSLTRIEDTLKDSDPVIRGALEDQIMVDPKLTQQANANAVSPGNLNLTSIPNRLQTDRTFPIWAVDFPCSRALRNGKLTLHSAAASRSLSAGLATAKGAAAKAAQTTAKFF